MVVFFFLIAESKSQQVWFITYKWKVPLMENCSPLINESVDIPIITSLAVQSSRKCQSPWFIGAFNKCLMFVIWHFTTTGVILKLSLIITFLSMQVTCSFTLVLQPVSMQVLCSLLSCICWFSNNVPRAFGGKCIGGLVCLGRDMSRWLSGHAWPSLLCLCLQLYIYSWEVLAVTVYSKLKNCDGMLSLLK